MVPTDLLTLPAFIFEICKTGTTASDGIFLDLEDLDKLPGVRALTRSIKKLLPPDLTIACVLRGPCIYIHLVASPNAKVTLDATMIAERGLATVEILRQTGTELKANANSSAPVPDDKAVSSPKAAVFLKEQSSAHRMSGLEVFYFGGGKEMRWAVAAPEDFVSTGERESRRKTGPFEVIGVLIRPDRVVVKEGVEIELPPDAQCTWEDVYQSLKNRPVLEGTIARNDENGRWFLESGGLLPGQLEAFPATSTGEET